MQQLTNSEHESSTSNVASSEEKRLKIVFFGTDEFAMIVLEALKEAGFDIKLAVTRPISSKNLELPTADLGVVAVYGKILPKRILEHFKYGVLNIHPSMLPKYRGPSPIRTSIANGDTETGVTIIKLNDKMDEGDIIANNKLLIKDNEMHSSLRDRLAKVGAKLLINIIPDYVSGNIKLQKQDHSKATYTKLLTRDDGKVDLQNDEPQAIYNKFRAYEDWPGIWTNHKGKRVKILDCVLDDGKLIINTLQVEGKRAMSMNDFVNGYGQLTSS